MDELHMRYMMAHVALNGRHHPETWTALQVADAFAILPPPVVSFPAWCAAQGADAPAPALDEAAAAASAVATFERLRNDAAMQGSVSIERLDEPKEA